MGLRLSLDAVPETAPEFRCKCSEVVVKSFSDGTRKVRNKVIVEKADGRVFAVCKGCNAEVRLPWRRETEALTDVGPELYLEK